MKLTTLSNVTLAREHLFHIYSIAVTCQCFPIGVLKEKCLFFIFFMLKILRNSLKIFKVNFKSYEVKNIYSNCVIRPANSIIQ